MDRFSNFISLGREAAMIFNFADADKHDESLDEVSDYIDDAQVCIFDEHEEYPKLY